MSRTEEKKRQYAENRNKQEIQIYHLSFRWSVDNADIKVGTLRIPDNAVSMIQIALEPPHTFYNQMSFFTL